MAAVAKFFFSDTGVAEANTALFACFNNNIVGHMKRRLGNQVFEMIFRTQATIVGDLIVAMLASAAHSTVTVLVAGNRYSELRQCMENLVGLMDPTNTFNCNGVAIDIIPYWTPGVVEAIRALDPKHVMIAWSPVTFNHIAVLEIGRANSAVLHAMPPAIYAKLANSVEKKRAMLEGATALLQL